VDIAILGILILINGMFAMAEIALVTARRNRLQKFADAGDAGSRVAIRLGAEPTQFLSTIQIGITAISILNGIYGEAVLAEPLAVILTEYGMAEQTSSIISTAIVVIGITYVSIVLGELIPKRIAQFNAEGIARLLSRPISILAKLSGPFVYLLSISTDSILRLIGQKETNNADITEEDIHAILAEGSETGIIEKQEHDLVRNVFNLDHRKIATLMTPLSDIVYLDIEQPLETEIQTLINSNHSRFPVCRGAVNEVLGVITTKRLLKLQLEGNLDKITDNLIDAAYVPESMTGIYLLEEFKRSGVHLIFVVDEYGHILGIITLQDVLEALAGEFTPRDPEEAWALQREDGSWLLDGLIPIQTLKERLGLKNLPEEEKNSYNTLGGMIMWLTGKLSKTGDTVNWENWQFEVVDLDNNRIDKVLASRLPDMDADTGTTELQEPGEK
jgi:putative hemolysin